MQLRYLLLSQLRFLYWVFIHARVEGQCRLTSDWPPLERVTSTVISTAKAQDIAVPPQTPHSSTSSSCSSKQCMSIQGICCEIIAKHSFGKIVEFQCSVSRQRYGEEAHRYMAVRDRDRTQYRCPAPSPTGLNGNIESTCSPHSRRPERQVRLRNRSHGRQRLLRSRRTRRMRRVCPRGSTRRRRRVYCPAGSTARGH